METENSNAILIVTKYGRKKDSTSVEVLAGTLLSLVEEKESKGKIELTYDVLDADKPIKVSCSLTEVRNITAIDKKLLRPIPTCKERLEVYTDNDWLNDGKKLKPGDQVYVKLKGEQSELPGVLRYKGYDFPDSKGVMFGVELKV